MLSLLLFIVTTTVDIKCLTVSCWAEN